MAQDKLLKTWEGYFRKLHNDIREILPIMKRGLQGPCIIIEEVKNAIRGMKKAEQLERIKFQWK